MGIFWIVLDDFWDKLFVLKIFLNILFIDKKKKIVNMRVINFNFYLFLSIYEFIFFFWKCVLN